MKIVNYFVYPLFVKMCVNEAHIGFTYTSFVFLLSVVERSNP